MNLEEKEPKDDLVKDAKQVGHHITIWYSSKLYQSFHQSTSYFIQQLGLLLLAHPFVYIYGLPSDNFYNPSINFYCMRIHLCTFYLMKIEAS